MPARDAEAGFLEFLNSTRPWSSGDNSLRRSSWAWGLFKAMLSPACPQPWVSPLPHPPPSAQIWSPRKPLRGAGGPLQPGPTFRTYSLTAAFSSRSEREAGLEPVAPYLAPLPRAPRALLNDASFRTRIDPSTEVSEPLLGPPLPSAACLSLSRAPAEWATETRSGC